MMNLRTLGMAGVAMLAATILVSPVMAADFGDAVAQWDLADLTDSSGNGNDLTGAINVSAVSAGNGSSHSGSVLESSISFAGGSTTLVRFRSNLDAPESGHQLLKKQGSDINSISIRMKDSVFQGRTFAGLPGGFETDPVMPGSHWASAFRNDSSFPVKGTWYDLVYRDDIDNDQYGIRVYNTNSGALVSLDSSEWQSFDLGDGAYGNFSPLQFGASASIDTESVTVWDQVLTNENLDSIIPEPASLALLSLGGLTMLRRRRA